MSSAIIGIDVAKEKLDVVLVVDGQARHAVLANTPSGLSQLRRWLDKRQVTQAHACLEGTGHYSEAVAAALHEAGYRVRVVNPARIKA